MLRRVLRAGDALERVLRGGDARETVLGGFKPRFFDRKPIRDLIVSLRYFIVSLSDI
jgi:hypothetical protein